jgi:hypothetical protein
MIHHETYSARNASESGGSGHFNVIEQRDGFHVVDGDSGMYLSEHGSLLEACEAAQKEADDYEEATGYRADKRAREIEKALRAAERSRLIQQEAQEAAEEALTRYFEAHLAELARRFPKRRFHASSGMGSLSIDITPGPRNEFGELRYSWVWGVMINRDSYWSFLWQPWEELLDAFAKRAGLEYVNFTRDIDIKGALWEER